jgi:ABC-type multidrug transport system fused ATPase/permease subunit
LPEPKITNEGKEYVLPGDLYFENVSFRYPGAKDDTLKNISFQ